MGRPVHYSMEIAARCQHLIELLADQTDRDPKLVERWRGPLRTTFLLAMSTPMLVLPMERLFKPVLRKAGVADDSKLDEAAGDRFRATFADGRPFHEAEFYEAKAWSYIAATQKFSVAEVWPSAIFDQLDTPEAFEAAAAAPTADILECLRNALSHGGVAYLDARGRATTQPTCSASPHTPRTIVETSFASFASQWMGTSASSLPGANGSPTAALKRSSPERGPVGSTTSSLPSDRSGSSRRIKPYHR